MKENEWQITSAPWLTSNAPLKQRRESEKFLSRPLAPRSSFDARNEESVWSSEHFPLECEMTFETTATTTTIAVSSFYQRASFSTFLGTPSVVASILFFFAFGVFSIENMFRKWIQSRRETPDAIFSSSLLNGLVVSDRASKTVEEKAGRAFSRKGGIDEFFLSPFDPLLDRKRFRERPSVASFFFIALSHRRF